METQPHILLYLMIVYIDDQLPQDLKVPSSKSMAPTEHKHTHKIWFRSGSSAAQFVPSTAATGVQIPALWVFN